MTLPGVPLAHRFTAHCPEEVTSQSLASGPTKNSFQPFFPPTMLSHPPARKYPQLFYGASGSSSPATLPAQSRGQPRMTYHSPSASWTHLGELLQGQADLADFVLRLTSTQRAECVLNITVTIQSRKSSGQQQGWVTGICGRTL